MEFEIIFVFTWEIQRFSGNDMFHVAGKYILRTKKHVKMLWAMFILG